MGRILILDDDKNRHRVFARRYLNHNITHVETIDDFEKALKEPKYDAIFLDHDLNDHGIRSFIPSMYGDQELTGVDAATMLTHLSPEKWPSQVLVHSWNPPGAARIAAILRDAKFPEVIVEPFNAE